ncbi:zealexin A1 synthase-like [Oryza glaberrima]|uniref:Cytochrome P450 n=1 Tax=Oryza glaberrima TaxID=4538 RepID=I1R385_ORYGL|nr:zealexin A1 synthase-like [Oryza glaberrima]
MELSLPLLIGVVLAFLLLFVLVNVKNSCRSWWPPPEKEKKKLRLPPGPWQLPLVGSLHHVLLSRHADLPHRALRELAGKYGPLMMLRFGAVPTLVVSSAEAAREVLKTYDAAFASRYLTPTLAVLSRGGRDILFSPYCDLWRQLRRICVHELLSARRVQSLRHVREDEAARLVRSVAAECAARGGAAVVSVGELISRAVNDSVVRSAVGARSARRDEFVRELDESVRLSGGFNLADLYPSSWLARRLSGAMRETERCNRSLMAIMDDIIREHGDGEEDLLGVLLRLQRNGDVQCPLTTDLITNVVLDMFAAGSETSSTTLEWALTELVRNPHIMEKAQSEVREIFRGENKLTEEMMDKLSYLRLVIRETLRLHLPVPFLLPRQCREPCSVMGYDIPVGTKVLVNAWAIARDNQYWDDPEVFKPERFENNHVDFKGIDFEFIPFGAGRRICPGIALGLANIELMLASLLYHFDWEFLDRDRNDEIDLSETFGITAKRKSKLMVYATQRIPCLG